MCWLRQHNTRWTCCVPVPSTSVCAQRRHQTDTSISWHEHITPMLHDLHWLRSPECVDFKLAVLIYWFLHGLALWYLSDSNCRRFLSSSSLQLVIWHTRLSTVGSHLFPVAGSRLWNSLLPDVTSAPMLTVFRNSLKTSLSWTFPS